MNCFCCSSIRANRQHGCGGVGGAFCHFTFLRARHLHGGTRCILEKLSRQALLEQAMRQTVQQRAAASPQSSLSHYDNIHSAGVLAANTDTTNAQMKGQSVNEDTTLNPFSAPQSNEQSESLPNTTLPPLEQKEHKENDMVLNSATIIVPIRSLSDFFAQCKQFRCRIGSAKNETARRREREAFRLFWLQHVGSAVQCCAKRGRDFGFVAANGLSDLHLHIAFSSMKLALRVIRQEASVCSARDMMVSLHYLARELHWWQRSIKCTQSQKCSIVELHQDSFQPLPTQHALDRFRSDLIDLTFDRVVFFFITHASPSSSNTRTANEELGNMRRTSEEMCNVANEATATNSSTMNGLIADADDALNALEALAHIHLRDAAPETVHKLTDSVAKSTAHHKYFTNMSSLPVTNYKNNKNNENINNIHYDNINIAKEYSAFRPSSSSSSTNSTEIMLTQRFFVSILFQFVAMQRRQLKMTSLVQAFALLRIFWSELSEQNKLRTNARQQTQIRKELHYICWGLALSLRKHDARFVNPYHFVKIVVTLEKLPYWLLSPTTPEILQNNISYRENDYSSSSSSFDNQNSVNALNSTKTHLTSFHSFMLSHSEKSNKSKEIKAKDSSGNSALARNSVWEAAASDENNEDIEDDTYDNSDRTSTIERMSFNLSQDATLPEQRKLKAVALSSEQFWQYIISKACIFVPMLSSEERKIVYYKLYQCIIIKRGNLLGQGNKQKAPNVKKMIVTENNQNLQNKAETSSPFAPLSMISSWEAMYSNNHNHQHHHHHHHHQQQQQQQQQQYQQERQQDSNNINYSNTTTTIVTSLTDSAEDTLLPLSEEMSNLNEDVNTIISRHQMKWQPSHA